MSANLRSLQAYRIVDFSGGLNEFDSSFTMENNQLQEATNVELRTGGAIRTRKGSPIYQSQTYSTFTTPFTTMFRYARFDGTKKVLAYSDDDVIADDDNGEFDPVLLGLVSDDGKCRFSQWRETALFCTKMNGPYAYDSNLFPSARNIGGTGIGSIHGQTSGGVATATVLTPITDVTNGALTLTYTYQYRYTFDVYHGNTFLGESGVIWYSFAPGIPPVRVYTIPEVTLAGLNNAVEIRCGALLAGNANNPSVGALNVYRSIVGSATATTPYKAPQAESNFAFVGSIPKSVWADTATVQILDLGVFAGRSIAPYYLRVERPPYGRFIAIHKSRTWIGNVKWEYYDNTTGLQVVNDAPHRIYFSEINEPGVFLPTSWVELDPTDGDGITAIVSFKNKVMIAFQANSIWAISGGDEEAGPGVPDISIENISTDVGCVAPESVQICEGKLVFLSHRGVYYYDGTSPKPLKTENIDSTLLDLRPAAKYDDPASVFLSKEREYWLSQASTDANANYQTLINKFSFKNGSYVRADHGTRGISSFLEKRDMGRPPILLAGLEASTSDMAETAVRRMDIAGYDSASTAISWSWKTKFYDLDRPYMDKKYVAILVQLESESNVTMQVSCDNHLVNESFTISNTENAQDFLGDDMVWADTAGTSGSLWSDGVTGTVWAGDNFRNALIYLNSKCWGKRISLRFSGSSTASPTEIQAVTIFYKQKEGVRQ